MHTGFTAATVTTFFHLPARTDLFPSGLRIGERIELMHAGVEMSQQNRRGKQAVAARPTFSRQQMLEGTCPHLSVVLVNEQPTLNVNCWWHHRCGSEHRCNFADASVRGLRLENFTGLWRDHWNGEAAFVTVHVGGEQNYPHLHLAQRPRNRSTQASRMGTAQCACRAETSNYKFLKVETGEGQEGG